jgi:Tfp pilus assembly protein PilF
MNINSPCSSIPSCRLLLLFSTILFLCYCNTFPASWQMDDRPNITKNHRIQITDITPRQLWKSMNAQPGSGNFYRPVACLSLALNWYFGKDNVFSYHVVNWLIHLTTSWLLFLAIITLLQTPQIVGKYSNNEITFIAVTATLFWALNPMQTQAVTYIVQRMTSLAALFSLLSIYCYLRGRLSKSIQLRQLLFAGSALSYLLAIFSKENSIILPLSLPVFEIFFFYSQLSKKITQRLLYGLAIGLSVSVLATIALQPDILDAIHQNYNLRPFTMLERILTEQRILLFYLTQLFFPHPSRLSIAHDFPLSTSLFAPWETAAAILTNALFILLALKSGRKYPFFALAVFFFYLNHLVESTVVPLELVFEHRNYLPSFFLFIPVALLFNQVFLRAASHKLAVAFAIFSLSALFAAEGYATYVRNIVWKSEQSLWVDALRKAPNSDRPLAVLALQLGWGEHATENEYRKALELIKRTLTMVKARRLSDAAQLGNAASLYHKLGEYQTSIEYYQQALRILPNDAMTTFNMAKTYISSGDFTNAWNLLHTILDQGYIHADYFHLLGFCELWLGKPEESAAVLRRAMSLAPGRPDILLALGRSLSLSGYYDRARWFLDMSRQKGGESPIVSLCLIENSLLGNNKKMAKAYLHHALQHHTLPSLFTTLTNTKTRYQSIPVNAAILQPFITEEVQEYVSP